MSAMSWGKLNLHLISLHKITPESNKVTRIKKMITSYPYQHLRKCMENEHTAVRMYRMNRTLDFNNDKQYASKAVNKQTTL